MTRTVMAVSPLNHVVQEGHPPRTPSPYPSPAFLSSTPSSSLHLGHKSVIGKGYAIRLGQQKQEMSSDAVTADGGVGVVSVFVGANLFSPVVELIVFRFLDVGISNLFLFSLVPKCWFPGEGCDVGGRP
ncbi:hypothetical protein CEXT_373001 [Caerostris extrusa]|uniref:Uncharacterized protein n=1 Tax=Caerostris extrusa TaxID=172846 RepID=A0AAV4UC12_CAEEX|nr:hypothetical protein CEXT_373001 [Caerostris extrusa]